MSNRPKFPPSQPTISINNLPALEELSSEEASAISGGGAPKPGDDRRRSAPRLNVTRRGNEHIR